MSLVRDPDILDNSSVHLQKGADSAPRVLLVTAHRWPTTTRLAHELSEAGLTVDALCPTGHSLTHVTFVARTYRYGALSPVRSLCAAIQASDPDLIIPSDDHTAAQLYELYALTDSTDDAAGKLRALLIRSLGDPLKYPILHARDQITSLARAAGVSCLPATTVNNEEELAHQLESIGLPAVLKTDKSSGGTGVVIAHTQADAKRAFRKLATPPGVVRALKRLIVDHDANLILPCVLRDRARVSVQRFMGGKAANAAVACWNGDVLAHVCVEVLATNGATGPATVVSVIAHPGMSHAVRQITRMLNLSGLCGFDFILNPSDGSAHLIELNPRATQTCHLVSFDREEVLASLAAKLKGLPVVDGCRSPHRGPVVLFPHGFSFDPENPYSQYAYRDLPTKSLELAKIGLEFSKQKRRLLTKAVARARRLP